MKRLPVLLALLLSSVAFAGSWKTLISPGPVGQSHDAIAGDCDLCHLVFDGIPDVKCLACHEGLAARIEQGKGFHAASTNATCIECHSDHGGLEHSLTRTEARATFDHGATGFDLQGAHASVDCATCHTAPVAQMASVCIECHADADPHESALGPECSACHVTTSWPEGLKTLAAHTVDTTGGHAGLACADCHHQGDNLQDDVPCAACHEEAHGGTTTACDSCHQVAAWKPVEFNHGPCTCTFAGAHQTASCLGCHPGFTFTDTPELCSGCHDPGDAHEPLGECSRCHEATTWSDNLFDHNLRSRFKIEGQHLTVDCAGCHTTPGSFRGAATPCAGCHAEAGLQAHGDFGACDQCHTTEHAGFVPSGFDHASTGFVLEGRHSTLPCLACHADKVSGYPGATP